jgi:aspartyl-tRNA(Asn)/glutamyl-tRNA(Gln) amidotransferase subunit A
MDRKKLPFLTVAELGRLIRGREISPVEATEAYLERIDELDFKFNSYLTVCRKEATRAAQEAEREIRGGNYRGPMHGIPVGIKDQMWTKGIRTTGGSRLLVDFIPEEDATAVAKLKESGAVILGKTNMTELAITPYTHRYSLPHNPWNLDALAGGSSSGSGAGTGAFMCATSLGEDTGGSIRRPASWCGVVGLRPTWGRVSRYGVMRGVWYMDAVGPISRTVEDAAITLGAVAGYDARDPYTWDVPVPDYTRALDGGIRGIRVGVVKEVMNSPWLMPEVRDVVVKATSVLGELGATVEEVSIPLVSNSNAIAGVSLAVEPATNQKEWLRTRLHEYGHDIRISLLTGSLIPAQAYYKAQKLTVMVRRQVHEALERYDVLVFPTSGRTAPRRTEDDPIFTSKETAARIPFVFNNTFNLASAPAISVPCGFSKDNLPVGLQIGGKPFAEETVFKVAHAYEQATPWHTMRPPNV